MKNVTKKQVVDIIEALKRSRFCYVSEAHIQLQFAIIGAQMFGDQFDFIPEFPGHTAYSTNAEQKTEFDLLAFDKKTREKTLIEFKYKTKNNAEKNKREEFPVVFGKWLKLANDGAHNPNRYDCWRDIYRIEQNVKHKEVNNGFFIFVTNDKAYIDKGGSNSVFCQGDDFSLMSGVHIHQTKRVAQNVKASSAGAFRKSNPIKMVIPDFADYGISLERFFVTNIVKPDGDRQFEKFKELHFRQYADIAEAKLRQQTDLIYAQTEAQKLVIDSQAQATKRVQEGYTYAQERGFDVAERVASNEAVGQFSNIGIGLGTMAGIGGAVGGVVGGAVNGAISSSAQPVQQPSKQEQNDESSSFKAKVEKLTIMKESGLITEDEFKNMKADLIKSIL